MSQERRLNPKDHPLEILQKWTDHASEVAFVLRRITDEEENSPYGNFRVSAPAYCLVICMQAPAIIDWQILFATLTRHPKPWYCRCNGSTLRVASKPSNSPRITTGIYV